MPAFRTKTALSLLNNQSGFVLVLSILILVILVIIGISTTRDSQVGLRIVGNDKIGKQTFYRASSGTEVGSRMVEENIACPPGFSTAGVATLNTNGIAVTNPSFWQNAPSAWTTTPPTTTSLYIADSECSPQPKPAADNKCYAAQAFTFANQDGWPSNIVVAGTTRYAAGSAIQMVSGYEGKGKGAAAGGATINYSIVSQALGASNSLSEVEALWRHMIGLEGECNY